MSQMNDALDAFEVLYYELRLCEVPSREVYEGILSETLSHTGEVKEIIGHEASAARLYYTLLTCCPKVFDGGDLGPGGGTRCDLPEHVRKQLVKVFDNIAGMSEYWLNGNGNPKSGDYGQSYVLVIDFLRSLRKQALGGLLSRDDNAFDGVSSGLLSMLAEIDFLFDIQIDGRDAFPIHTALEDFIKGLSSSDVGVHIQEKEVRLLQLAVRLFREGKPKELLSELVERCNLQFINFLGDNCRIIDTKDFDSYKANDVIVFWNENTHQVLVRSNRDEYFDKPSCVSCAKRLVHEELQHESDANGKSLCPFAIWDWGEETILTSVDEVVDEDKGALKLLRLIFDDGCRNILIKRALVKLPDESICPVNPWCSGDAYIVKSDIRGKARAVSTSHTVEAFGEYGIVPVCRDTKLPLNRLTFGFCARLLDASGAKTDVLGINNLNGSFWYQAQVIERWAASTPDFPAVEKVLTEWEKQIGYRTNQGRKMQKFTVAEFKPIDFLPLRHGNACLLSLLVPGVLKDEAIAQTLHLCIGKVYDDDEGLYLIPDKVPTASPSEQCLWRSQHIRLSELEDVGGSSERWDFGITAAALYSIEAGRGYVVRESIAKLVGEIVEVDGGACSLDFGVCKEVGRLRFEETLERIKLFETALLEGISNVHKGRVGKEQILSIRFMHNLIWARATNENVCHYLNLILRHSVLDFNNFGEDKVVWESGESVLLVPKDDRDSDSTLCRLIERYRPCSARNHDPYYRHLEFGKGVDGKSVYYIKGCMEPIKKIVLITDNILSGSGTCAAITAYFDAENLYKPNDERDKGCIEAAKKRCMHYVDAEGTEVSLSELMSTNGITEVNIHAHYGTKEGVAAIVKRLELLGIGSRGNVAYYSEIETPDRKTMLSDMEVLDTDRVNKLPRYPVIRQYNMPKQSVFKDAMMTHPKRFISMFVKKDEFD